MSAVVIVGAGRQGRSALEAFRSDPEGPPVAGFLDDTKDVGQTILDCPVLGGFDLLDDVSFVANNAWFVGLGDNETRVRIGQGLQAAGATLVNAIHAKSEVSLYSKIGVGVYISAFAHLGSLAQVGDWCLIGSHCVVGNDTWLGEGAFLGASVNLAGGSAVGAHSFVGSGSVVSNRIKVGARCTIGANAAIVRDVPDDRRAQGVPGRLTNW